MTTTLAEKIALVLTTPGAIFDPDEHADALLKALTADGFGPAERANVCARLEDAAPFTSTYEEWVVQAKLALERA